MRNYGFRKRILVTGGADLLGSHLCDRLLEHGHEVLCVDNLFAGTKRCAENLFFDYHRPHALEIKVARIFNTYAPRMHPADGRVVSNFIVQALKNEPITIYGEGQQTRSFCCVDDLIGAFVAFMATPPELTGPVNLGNPNEFRIIELAEKIIAITGSRSTILRKPRPEDDPAPRQLDIALARKHIDWEPRVQLDAGLKTPITYFESMLGS